MTKPAAFKQADVERACKGAAKAGLPIGGVRVLPDGTIEVFAAGNDLRPATRKNPLDRLHAA